MVRIYILVFSFWWYYRRLIKEGRNGVGKLVRREFSGSY